MRTNIEIDDSLMATAMAAGGYKTKKEAVEQGLRLLARSQTYQKLLALRGKLRWADDDDVNWTQPGQSHTVQEPSLPPYVRGSRARP